MTELRLGGSLPNKPLKLRLKALREAQGITREELAARVGCSRMTILRLERGDGRPNARDLEKLAKALGGTVDELLPDAAGRGGPRERPAGGSRHRRGGGEELAE